MSASLFTEQALRSDQAWGLRQRTIKRSLPFPPNARLPLPSEPPLISLHWAFLGARPQAHSRFFWHWLPGEGATGWDANARFHARGMLNQFERWELEQWRFYAREWNLFSGSLAPLPFADRLILWMPPHREVRKPLYRICKSLYKNLSNMPIILIGSVSGFHGDVSRALRRDLALEVSVAATMEEAVLPYRREGYYRMLDACRRAAPA
ncbi:MAG: hypothetical protein KIT45_10820 [Fimbriimonadia bacterium]|nr:hypothetical protein [Fimbriimonadia bacterium]